MHPMNDRRVNWSLWTGLALSVIAVASYVLVFYRFPITRDVPWVSYLLFVVGARVPALGNPPAVGAKAPDFTLLDADRKPVALSQMLAAPGAKGVLLVFYRGYW